MKVYSQLEKAQIENLGADPTGTGLVVGRIWYRTDEKLFKVYDGAAVQTFVDLNTAQTLVNKILTTPQIDDAAIFEQITTPANPSSGYNKIYPKSDGKFYNLKADGTEEELGSGGQGGINYIDNNDFESNVLGWSITKNTSANATPDNGFSASSTDNTIARSTSSPLRGTASGLYTLATLGNQLVKPFTIDSADKYKVLQGSFDYSIASGTYADDTVTVWIYDIANDRFRQPTPYLLKNHSLPSERMFFEFQCTDSTSYYLVLHQAAASTAALKIDNFIVGPQAKLYGSAVTDPVAYTPTITGFGTVSGVNFKSWKDGKFLFFEGVFTSGTPTAVEAQVTLGFGGANANVSTVSTLPTTSVAGQWARGTSATTNVPILLQEPSKTYVTFATQTASFAGLTKRNGNDLVGAGDIVSINGKVEIQGWSSSQILSQDASSRVVAVRAFRETSAQSISGASDVKVQFNGLGKDTHGCFDNVTNYRFTAKVSGEYEFDGMLAMPAGSGATVPINLYKNGSPLKTIGWLFASATQQCVANFKGSDTAVAGDYYEVFVNPNGVSNDIFGNNAVYGGSQLNIKMLQGPAQIMASDSVSCRYRSGAGQSITNATTPVVVFGTKVYDSHNAYNSSTGVFTAPISGEYEVASRVRYANSQAWTASSSYAASYMYKNGASYSALGEYSPDSTNTPSNSGPALLGTDSVKLLAGETIDLRTAHNESSARTLLASDAHNWITIKRTGNY